MIVCLLIATFFGVIVSGPAGMEVLERRRIRRDHPRAIARARAQLCELCGRRHPLLSR